MSDIYKVLTVLRRHKKLTRKEVGIYSGVGNEAISRATKKLIKDGFVSRLMGSGNVMGKQVTFTWIGA